MTRQQKIEQVAAHLKATLPYLSDAIKSQDETAIRNFLDSADYHLKAAILTLHHIKSNHFQPSPYSE